MLMDMGDGWRLLTVPSAFEMGLSDCRWVYKLDKRKVTVLAIVCGDEPAMQWCVNVDGPPCRFLVFGHLALGEQESGPAGRVEIDAKRSVSSSGPIPMISGADIIPRPPIIW